MLKKNHRPPTGSKAKPPAAGSLSRLKAPPFWQQPAVLGGMFVLLVLAAYWPALHAGFIWDDDKYVTHNPLLTDAGGLREIWFSAHTQSQYFPLVYTTFRLEHALWGLNPLGYHLVNVLLHGLNAALVWTILKRLLVPGAWLAAAIFALHPVNVESVAWVTELKNVESLFFYVLALLAWLKFLDASGPPPWRYYLLALFAKTTACTLPVALALILWLRGQRFTWARAGQIIPFVILGVGMGLVSIWWEGNLGSYNEDAGPPLTLPQRLLLAGRALWFYAGKLAWPANLTFSYPHWELNPASPAQYLPLLGVALVAVGVWVWRRKIGRDVIAGLVFFAAALAPLLGFITDYTFRYSYVADHYQYVAGIGLFAIVAAGWKKGSPKTGFSPSVLGWFPCALLLTLGWLTWQQCGAYQNSETLWRDTLAKNPGSWMAHYNLAMDLQDQGRLDEAIEQFHETLALNPQHAKAENNLGLALATSGRLSEAVAHYQAALKLKPDDAGVLNNLAVAFAGQGDLAQAVTQLQRAVQLNPKSFGLWINLGGLLKQAGRREEAAACYQRTATLFPSEVEPLRRLAELYMETGRLDEAVKQYRLALQLAPQRANLLLALGNAFATETNYDEAVSSYRQALQSEPSNAGIHYNLGLILARQGRIESAREELTETLRLRPDFSPAAQRLKLLTSAPAE
jgi:tetratricopeptide (TPR) repeat protein